MKRHNNCCGNYDINYVQQCRLVYAPPEHVLEPAQKAVMLTHRSVIRLRGQNISLVTLHLDGSESVDHFKHHHHHHHHLLLSAQCISNIGQNQFVCLWVSEWVSLSHKTSWTLYRSQSFTDLHQTYHQGRVPRDVVTYCFWWKSKILLSAKPEVELILIVAPVEKFLNVESLENGER